MIKTYTATLAALAIALISSQLFAQESAWETHILPGDPGWVMSMAEDLTEQGLIVGRYMGTGTSDEHALAWNGGGYIELESRCGIPDGFTHSVATTVNESGLIGGEVKVQPGWYPIRAILWDFNARTYEVVHPEGVGYDHISRVSRVYDDGSALISMYRSAEGSPIQGGYWRGPNGVGSRLFEAPEGWHSCSAIDIDATGKAVGFVFGFDPNYHGHAVIWQADGSIQDLHAEIAAALPPGEGAALELSIAYRILPDGTVFGFARDGVLVNFYSWARSPDGEISFLPDGGHGGAWLFGAVSSRIAFGTVGPLVTGVDNMYGAVWVDGILGLVPRPTGYGNMNVYGASEKAELVGLANFEGVANWWEGGRPFIAEPTADGDLDGDALKDKWELQGYVHDNGESVDLFGMGANPLRKDLFVEIDAMAGHRPDPETLQPVIDAFAAHDIALHLHLDDDLPLDAELGTLDSLKRYQWEEFDVLKAAHFDEELESAVRYCVFAHRLATLTDSGLARGEPSSDFIVSLGAFVEESGSTDPWMQAGTFMHELGHILGLRHGGADVTNRKPNYLSVMNYDFQKAGLRIGGQDGHFDYSTVKLADLDESELSEDAGLGAAAAGYQTLFRVATLDPITYEITVVAVWSGDAQGSIDWDGSGGIDVATVSADINADGAFEMLTSHDDWANLDFNGGTVGFGVGLPPPPPPEETEVVEELTVEEAKVIPPPPVEGLAGRAGRGSVRLSWTPVGPYGQGLYKVYRWSGPNDRVLVAETQASLISDRPGRGTWHYAVTITDALGAESLDSEVLALRVR